MADGSDEVLRQSSCQSDQNRPVWNFHFAYLSLWFSNIPYSLSHILESIFSHVKNHLSPGRDFPNILRQLRGIIWFTVIFFEGQISALELFFTRPSSQCHVIILIFYSTILLLCTIFTTFIYNSRDGSFVQSYALRMNRSMKIRLNNVTWEVSKSFLFIWVLSWLRYLRMRFTSFLNRLVLFFPPDFLSSLHTVYFSSQASNFQTLSLKMLFPYRKPPSSTV